MGKLQIYFAFVLDMNSKEPEYLNWWLKIDAMNLIVLEYCIINHDYSLLLYGDKRFF